MKSLSEVIADFYIEKNIISSDMKSVYVYGISLIINDIIDFAVILIPAIVICTPKVRHFWRCIFLWQRKGKNIENTRQNSNYLL